ncbi:hypothetical protein [Orlajensenia leifsoniae]|uniref:MarR family transcriptional regulator n=1 Tax=Orlajensenia leifsoniae TaxID=2561933 RepID=A0A4Y9QZI6_9MICO|nr:hypothetical protein [Leifsonia flava]TFV98001.1 hypothetical protein E4M00_08085 [Leifsonia flava]
MSTAEAMRAEVDDRLELMLALQYTARHGSVSVGELAHLLESAPDAAMTVVRELVRGGLVLCRISGRGSETVDLFLTSAGRERARREGEAVVRAASGLLGAFAPEERAVIEQALGLQLGEDDVRDA